MARWSTIAALTLVVEVALAAWASPAPAGPKLYVGLFRDNAVAVVDTATNRVVGTIPVPKGPHGLVVTPDGRKLYVSSDGDSSVSVIDTASDRVVATVDVGANPHGLAMAPDGKLVLVSAWGSQSGRVPGHRHRPGRRTRARGPGAQRDDQRGRALGVGGVPAAGGDGPGAHRHRGHEGSGPRAAGQDTARPRPHAGRAPALLHRGRPRRRPGARHGHRPGRGGDPGGRLTASGPCRRRRALGPRACPGTGGARSHRHRDQYGGGDHPGGKDAPLGDAELRRRDGLRLQ